MILRVGLAALAAAAVGMVAQPRLLGAQSSRLRVIGTDSMPVAYAWVSIQGGLGGITDEKGELTLGQTRRKQLATEVRRIGYSPWAGNIVLPDSAVVITVQLARLAQSLGTVSVTGQQNAAGLNLPLRGFYDRWMMRQKGALSATFIGPEEIETRRPSRPSDLLYGIPGVSLSRTPRGGMVAKAGGGTCYMAVMLDGHRICPASGCHTSEANSQNAGQLAARTSLAAKVDSTDDNLVDLNQYVNISEVAAIEVYVRGGNMPISLQVTDSGCGVIAIWTGSRR
jgi:hypothetical protein